MRYKFAIDNLTGCKYVTILSAWHLLFYTCCSVIQKAQVRLTIGSLAPAGGRATTNWVQVPAQAHGSPYEPGIRMTAIWPYD